MLSSVGLSKAVFYLLDLVGICSFDLSFLENDGHQKHIWVHLNSVLQHSYQDLDGYRYHQWSCPKNFTSVLWHFSALRVRPNCCKQRRTFCRHYLCSSWVLACTTMSSMWQTTPSMSWRISAIWHWKCSGAEVIPKGSIVKQNHPKGIMNVVRRDDSGVSGICQNPELASN